MRSLKRLTNTGWASFAFAATLFLATFTGITPAQAAICSPSSAPNTSNSAITVLTFTTVTTCDWQVPTGVTAISLVVVGGGGGGGGDAAGGGGAGGMYINTNYSVTPGNTISVKVGAGGAGGYGGGGVVGNGDDSCFGSITTPGGGKGGVYYNGSGGNGGSGGGGSGPSGIGGIKTVSGANYFGNNGGTGDGASGGAGGGGAGAVGISSSPGAGGNGKDTTITGSQIYFAGGGGGGDDGGGQASGGLGGGGAGSFSCGANTYSSSSNPLSAQSGATSTGGGGGGAPWGCQGSGGNGGSGIVILSFLQDVTTSISIALTNSLSSAIYRTASTIQASVVGANGKVRFMQNGKVIPGCAAVQSISLVAICNWKPSTRGSARLSARLIPSSAGFLNSTSSNLEIFVTKRMIKR